MKNVKCDLQCPYCYANRRGRENYRGHWGYRVARPLEVRGVGKFTELRPIDSVTSAEEVGVEDSHLEALFPAMHEYLTELGAGPGGKLQGATILLFIEDGTWRACLNDRLRQRSLWATGASVRGCLQALEANLQTGGQGWRVATGGPRSPRGKKS